jgi:hypothetical protein
MADDERLPTGATLFPSAADEIVDDGVRLKATYKFWTEQFAAESESCLDGLKDSKTPGARFVRNLSDKPIEELLKDRPPVLIVNRSSLFGGDSDLLLDLAGCLMSGAEISKTIGGDGTIESLASDLLNLKKVGATAAPQGTDGGAANAGSGDAGQTSSDDKPDLSAAVRGIYAARELYDAVRRYRIAQDHAQRWDLPSAECLALHRQEGALAITPIRKSVPHGPLIQTGTPCRPAGIQHNLNGMIANAIERPGFSLVLPIEIYFKGLGLVGKESEPSRRFEVVVTDMLATGGLDNIVAWLPENDASDELEQVITFAFNTADGSETSFNTNFLTAMKCTVDDLSKEQFVRAIFFLVQNLTGALFEVSKTSLSAATAINTALALLSALMRSHIIESISRDKRTDVHLIGDDHNGDTESVLRVQTLWYRSRKPLLTLMPRRDRAPDLKDLEFTPLVSYLRFHTGDAMFMGIVLRLLRVLEDLARLAAKNGAKANPPWGAQFLAAIKSTGWLKRTAAEKRQVRQDLQHWHAHVNMKMGDKTHPSSETVWRYVGLISELRKGSSPPSWLGEFTPPSKKISKNEQIELFKQLQHTADVATRTVKLILKYNLMETLGLALETIPVTTLVDAGALPLPARKASNIPRKFFPQLGGEQRLLQFRKVAARAPLVKAHNFERLRLIYEAAQTSKS